MIKLIKIECPSCGAALEKKGFNNYRCKFCNAQYILDMDVIVPAPAKKEKCAPKTQAKAQISGKQKQSTKKNTNKSSKKTAQTQKSTAAYKGIICFAAVLLIGIGIFGGFRGRIAKKNTGESLSGNIPSKGSVAGSQAVDTRKIQSAYFQQFVQLVFEKDLEQVTEEDCREITYFAMHSNKYIVDYKRKDGELQTVTIPSDASIQYSDIQAFPEIKVLKWEAYKENNAVIAYLPKLEDLSCSISPLIVLKYLPHPEQLKKLSCKYYEEGDGVGELDKFENLTDLSLTIHQTSISNAKAPDLSSIAKLSKLESFYLKNDEYQTVSFLSDLTGLKSVSLHCDTLRDLGFLAKLSELEELTLIDCDILSVENLKYTPGLKVLHLQDCNQVDTLEPVAKLDQLQELMLSYHYGQGLPESFAKLSNVTRLTLEGFYDISLLADFPHLTFLQMYGCNYTHFEKVAAMKDLQELKLGAGTNLNNLVGLQNLQKLEKVDFCGMRTAADTEQLFMIPNLKELNLNDTEFTLDLNLVEKNESLEKLYMENLKWSAYNTREGIYQYNYENWQSLPINECIGFLVNFPNLKELSIQGNKVDSVGFTQALTKLQKLDITNNYVTDLQVLNQLPNLQEVRCGENPLASDTGLDSRITVDDTTQATERWPFVHYDWE